MEAQALALLQTQDIDDLLARVLAARGVTCDDAATYLDPTLRELMPDPSTLTHMDAAIERSRSVRSKPKSRSPSSATMTWTARRPAP